VVVNNHVTVPERSVTNNITSPDVKVDAHLTLEQKAKHIVTDYQRDEHGELVRSIAKEG
jgi:hypothetical protein